MLLNKYIKKTWEVLHPFPQQGHQASSFFSPSFSFSFLASSFFSLSFSSHHQLLQLSIKLFFKICKHWDLCGEFIVNCVLAFCTFLLHQHRVTPHLKYSNSIVTKHHEPWLFCFSSCCWWDCARQQLSATCCPNIVLASERVQGFQNSKSLAPSPTSHCWKKLYVLCTRY